jgi:hypothetical protein
MNTIPIKPLSVNQAWQGKRFKTDSYKRYERDLMRILPKSVIIPEGPLCLRLEFGFSSAASDWDNPIKPFQDILQKKYNFDDKRVKLGVVAVQSVKRGAEYIKFSIDALEDAA